MTSLLRTLPTRFGKPLFCQRVLFSTSKSVLDGNNFEYKDIIKDFDWKCPEQFNFAQDVIDKWAQDKVWISNLLERGYFKQDYF